MSKELGFDFAARGALPHTEKGTTEQLCANSACVQELLSAQQIATCFDSPGESTGGGRCLCSHPPA